MPVILAPDAFDGWMDSEASVEDSRVLMEQNLGDDLDYYRVGRDVNSSKHDRMEFIQSI